MRLMIDTNIFLDVILQREPFFEASKKLLTLCENKKINGFLSASAATDIFYIIKKALHSSDEAYKALGSILNIVKILTVTNEDVLNAFMLKAPDFEDSLLATCAKSNKCIAIVTRNKKDFDNFKIKIFTPEEIISIIKE